MPKSILCKYTHADGCPFHRVLQPARFCDPDVRKAGLELFVDADQNEFPEGHDAYLFHGLIHPNSLHHLGRWKRAGAKFIWGLDDDFHTIPDWSPARQDEYTMRSWHIAKEFADLIVVSTPALATTLSDVSHKVVVCPNLLDMDLYPPTPEQIAVTLPVRVCWVGGRTHRGDLDLVTPVLAKLLKRFPKDKVSVTVLGMAPPSALIRDHLHKGLHWVPPVPFAQFQKVLNGLEPDVYLAPLVDIPFNHSKSNLRILEGWALLSCPVASPVGEYNVIRPGVDGRLAATEDEWLSVLSRLVEDHEYRVDMAVAGHKRVSADFAWQNRLARRPWVEAFCRAVDVEPPPLAD